jgi:hypothetical protein
MRTLRRSTAAPSAQPPLPSPSLPPALHRRLGVAAVRRASSTCDPVCPPTRTMRETTTGSRVGPAVVVAAAAVVAQRDGTGIVVAAAEAGREASNRLLLRHFRSATVAPAVEEAGGIAPPIFTFPRLAGTGTIPRRRLQGRAGERGTRRPLIAGETETTTTRIAITPREAGTQAEAGGGERLLRGTTRRGSSSRRTGEACTAVAGAIAIVIVLGQVRRAVRGACLNVLAAVEVVAAEEEGVARLRAGVRRRRSRVEEVGEVLPTGGATSDLPRSGFSLLSLSQYSIYTFLAADAQFESVAFYSASTVSRVSGTKTNEGAGARESYRRPLAPMKAAKRMPAAAAAPPAMAIPTYPSVRTTEEGRRLSSRGSKEGGRRERREGLRTFCYCGFDQLPQALRLDIVRLLLE